MSQHTARQAGAQQVSQPAASELSTPQPAAGELQAPQPAAGGAPHPQPAPGGTQDASACPRQSSARLSRAARAARRPPAAAAQTHHGMHPPQALLYMVASDTHRTPLVRLPAAGKYRLHGRTIGGLLSVSLRREHDDHQLQVATVAVAMAVAVRYTTTSGGEQTAMCRRPVPVRSACGCCTAASPEICDAFFGHRGARRVLLGVLRKTLPKDMVRSKRSLGAAGSAPHLVCDVKMLRPRSS